MAHSTFRNNSANGNGGGVSVVSATGVVNVSDTSVEGNVASGDGGGLYISDGVVVVARVAVHGNDASGGGGGAYAEVSTLDLVDSNVTANAAGTGGGLYVTGLIANAWDDVVTLNRTNVTCNSALESHVTQCSFSSNFVSSAGGVVVCSGIDTVFDESWVVWNYVRDTLNCTVPTLSGLQAVTKSEISVDPLVGNTTGYSAVGLGAAPPSACVATCAPTCSNGGDCNDLDACSTECDCSGDATVAGYPGGETCTIALCGDSIVAGDEECDDGNALDTDGCRNNCTLPVCGDGFVEGAEECDDGNALDTDGCSNSCTFPVCGDGVAAGTEECDDGNALDTDGCSNNCTLPVCGDGVAAGTEECDDGNAIPADGCENNCTLSPATTTVGSSMSTTGNGTETATTPATSSTTATTTASTAGTLTSSGTSVPPTTDDEGGEVSSSGDHVEVTSGRAIDDSERRRRATIIGVSASLLVVVGVAVLGVLLFLVRGRRSVDPEDSVVIEGGDGSGSDGGGSGNERGGDGGSAMEKLDGSGSVGESSE